MALINRRDPWHERTVRELGILRAIKATIIIPRIAFIECLGHITRGCCTEDVRRIALDSLNTLGWRVEEHSTDDFKVATEWWRKYADWPMEYPDTMIVAAAVRLAEQDKRFSVWSMDAALERFINNAAPRLRILSFTSEGFKT